MYAKLIIIFGAVNALLAVLLGAFAAHGLKNKIEDYYLQIFHTAVDYQFYHALGLILIGIIAHQWVPNVFIKSSGWIMLCGIIIFSGSLYILALTQIRWLGAITPIGGMLFIVAWLSLIAGIVKSQAV